MRGVEQVDLPSGARYLKIHHYADEEKDEAWLEKVRTEMSGTPDEFARQILMDESVHGGVAVFPTYLDALHCPEAFRKADKRIPLWPDNCHYFGGWDAGTARTPAFSLHQVMLRPAQIHKLGEVVSYGGESMEDFAPRVLTYLTTKFDSIWDSIQHYGDSTVNTKGGNRSTSAADEARKHGIDIKPVSNAWAPRYGAVSWALKGRINETTPMYVIDGFMCPITRKAFQGGYKFKESPAGDPDGPGRILLEPAKNIFSHVMDSEQYSMIKIRRLIEGGGARIRETE